MRNQILALLSIAFLSFSFVWHVNAEWVLKKNKDGIKVYTKKIEGSKLKAYKATVDIQSTVKDALALVLNFEEYPKWQHNCKSGRLVKSIDDRSMIVYTVTDAPWPVADRDIVVRYDIARAGDGSTTVNMSAKEGMVEAKKGNVRITYMKGYWKISPIKEGGIKITHQAHADPAGNIPDWLANSAVTETPFETLKKMRQLLEK